MKRIELEKFLSAISPELFSFAFVLIPDDLQAGQLIIDSIQGYIVSKREMIEDLLKIKTKNQSNNLQFLKKDLLRLIYELSRKRYHQLRLSINDMENNNDFYSLEFDEKATLFLKEKLKFTIEDVANITMKTKGEAEAFLFGARMKMIEKIPFEINREINI